MIYLSQFEQITLQLINNLWIMKLLLVSLLSMFVLQSLATENKNIKLQQSLEVNSQFKINGKKINFSMQIDDDFQKNRKLIESSTEQPEHIIDQQESPEHQEIMETMNETPEAESFFNQLMEEDNEDELKDVNYFLGKQSKKVDTTADKKKKLKREDGEFCIEQCQTADTINDDDWHACEKKGLTKKEREADAKATTKDATNARCQKECMNFGPKNLAKNICHPGGSQKAKCFFGCHIKKLQTLKGLIPQKSDANFSCVYYENGKIQTDFITKSNFCITCTPNVDVKNDKYWCSDETDPATK